MKTSNIFEQNPKKTIVAIVLISLFIIDATAGNLYKHIFGYYYYEKSQQIEKTYRVASDIYHHDLAKNIYLDNAMWGNIRYTLATDSLGFKSDKQKNTPLISNKFRILFIGDSFTEGVGLRYQDTFVGQIADNLLKENIEVLNAGVSSYSPIIYYRKIKYLLDKGLKFNELVVYIDISDIQDEAVRYEMSSKNTVKEKTKRTVKNGIKTEIENVIKNNFILLHFILKYVYDSTFYRSIVDVDSEFEVNLPRSMWTIDENIFKEYGDEGLKKSKLHMDKLHHLLRLNGIELTIAVYPWPDQIVNNDLNSIQVKYWRNWAQNNQVNFLNYFPCFISQPSKENITHFDTLRKYFIESDMHWNKKGHDLIADEYISFYSRKNGECSEQGTTLNGDVSSVLLRTHQ